MTNVTEQEFAKLTKLSVAKLTEGLIVSESLPKVWRMVKALDTFERDELTCAYKDDVKGYGYYAVPEDDIPAEWKGALSGKTFSIRDKHAIVSVGIAVAMIDWTPDVAKGQKGDPILAGQRKHYAMSI